MPRLNVQLALPEWLADTVTPGLTCADAVSKVELAVRLAARNVELGTGGPFGAAIFDGNDQLVAVGVNRVVPENSSVAHAEMMAFMSAQAALGRARLNDGHPGMTLATSAQPCCMCYGASFWAGIDTLLIGASSDDVMRLTDFDEGPLPADWRGELERRGIRVHEGIAREAACSVLKQYADGGGIDY